MRRSFVLVAGLLLACTGDFESFHVSLKDAGGELRDGSAGGAGGSQNAGGAVGSGGAAVGGAVTGGGPQAGGSPGDGATGIGGTLSDGATGCAPQQKRCGARCSGVTNPATGCADPASCSACSLPNVSAATCNGTGDCAPATCAGGFGDCNKTASDGCEDPIGSDPLNCGACDRLCSTTNVAARVCAASRCSSTCSLGYANCASPSSGADDGCERDVRANNNSCGSCSNNCSGQGLVCIDAVCGCTADGQCKANGPAGATPTCDTATAQCHCGTTVCARGEQCRSGACQCNGGTPCASPATCCRNPSGCFDLTTDPANCGACGRACVTAFACVAGVCQCDADTDCNAGTAGTCSAGLCTCGVAICQPGQRCLGDGQCG